MIPWLLVMLVTAGLLIATECAVLWWRNAVRWQRSALGWKRAYFAAKEADRG